MTLTGFRNFHKHKKRITNDEHKKNKRTKFNLSIFRTWHRKN